MTKHLIFHLALFFAIAFTSCGIDGDTIIDEPQSPPDTPAPDKRPEDPTEVPNDTIEVSFACILDPDVEDLFKSRAGGGEGDLIGINVYEGDYANTNVRYAAAVFDDVSRMVFKLLKGHTYSFITYYVQDAKSYVYKYPDGSFGLPFRNNWFDTHNEYLPNEIYYDDGYREPAYYGPNLYGLGQNRFQTTSDGNASFTDRLDLTCFYGVLITTITEDTKTIEVPLDLCRIGITLNVSNFTKGQIKFDLNGDTERKIIYTYEPGGNNRFEITCDGYDRNRSGLPSLSLRIYYCVDDKTYLIGTSTFNYEYKKNYVFNIDLDDQIDGGIRLALPTDSTLEDQEMELD